MTMAHLRSLDAFSRAAAGRLDEARVPDRLKQRRRRNPPGVGGEWSGRLRRFRTEIVPWLDSTSPLAGTRILEIGCGSGASTASMAEQGAEVTGIDLDGSSLEQAGALLASMGLSARFEVRNATELSAVQGRHEWVIFWAALEHMTVAERLVALGAAWDHLGEGGLLTLIETPNRLWPLDSHTSQLPFFSWLPHELAYLYSSFSPRPGFGDRYAAGEQQEMEHFLRRGHGVSFHEFDLAISDHRSLHVASCLQIQRREQNPARRLGWILSHAGRTERALAAFAPASHPAWFQPFLYLTLRKS